MRPIALLALAAASPAFAGSVTTLGLSGDCPGDVTIDIAGAPGGYFAIAAGEMTGSTIIPGGACEGTELGVESAGALRLFGPIAGGPDGMASFTVPLPDMACDMPMVAIDMSTCAVSSPATAGGIGDVSDLEGAMPMAWHDLITSPHVIDSFAANDISDGGSDMYDGGNHIRPYGDGVELNYSGGALDTGNAYVDYITVELASGQIGAFTTKDAIDMHIEGNNGADGGGSVQEWTGVSGDWTAYNKTVCDAFDPSINHMWIVQTADGATHSYESNSDNDGDYLSGLPSGTTFLYVLWAESSGRCPTDDDKMAIFDSVLSELP